MTFLDKTFCASTNCRNECGRQMTQSEKESLKELAFYGFKPTILVSWGYFCGEEDEKKTE
jgi:hypothetical protein